MITSPLRLAIVCVTLTFAWPAAAQIACSPAETIALAKAGYTKAEIEKTCAAKADTPAPATRSPAVQAPPPEVLAQHLRSDPTDKADLKAVIKDVQTKLNTFGFGAGTPDGAPGRKTAEAQERLKQAFGVDLAGLPYTEQNRILDHLLASEAGKKYVAAVEKLESLSKNAIPKTQTTKAQRNPEPNIYVNYKSEKTFEAPSKDWLAGTWCVDNQPVLTFGNKDGKIIAKHHKKNWQPREIYFLPNRGGNFVLDYLTTNTIGEVVLPYRFVNSNAFNGGEVIYDKGYVKEGKQVHFQRCAIRN